MGTPSATSFGPWSSFASTALVSQLSCPSGPHTHECRTDIGHKFTTTSSLNNVLQMLSKLSSAFQCPCLPVLCVAFLALNSVEYRPPMRLTISSPNPNASRASKPRPLGRADALEAVDEDGFPFRPSEQRGTTGRTAMYFNAGARQAGRGGRRSSNTSPLFASVGTARVEVSEATLF
jgi:hypothetical protein